MSIAGMPSSSSSWSVILQIFVIFSCLFVFVASRPADLLQFDDGSNDGGELLNIQRLQKLPYAAAHLNPNQIYTLKRSNPWGNILTDDFAPGGGSDILGIMNYKGLRG
uniref:Uncharacterized protein n=1 Tax=Panagrolaimus sp. ES5 TaxID=591445 RepID=A0AC34FEX9_9BILA